MIPIDPIAGDIVPLEDMSRITGLSAFHLQRKFKAALGVTPKQFHARCRMERVKKSLRKSETVTEAIYEAGFGSSSRLYERVDTQLGMTPAEYKAEGRGVEISYVILSTRLVRILIAATGCGRRWRGNNRRHHTPRRCGSGTRRFVDLWREGKLKLRCRSIFGRRPFSRRCGSI